MLARMDPVRIGLAVRALRRRRSWRQVDLAAAAGVGHDTVSRVERGRLDGVPHGTLRRLCGELGATVSIEVRWRGGALDRLLDERHALLCGRLAERLSAMGWQVQLEVSFAHFGERGAIDLLGWSEPTGTLLVTEVKTELTSIEATLRSHDAKVRLGPKVARERFGWRVGRIGRLLVLLESTSNRRRVQRHAHVLAAALPVRGSAVTEWLRVPSTPLAGLWFLPLADEVRVAQGVATSHRVNVHGRGSG